MLSLIQNFIIKTYHITVLDGALQYGSPVKSTLRPVDLVAHECWKIFNLFIYLLKAVVVDSFKRNEITWKKIISFLDLVFSEFEPEVCFFLLILQMGNHSDRTRTITTSVLISHSVPNRHQVTRHKKVMLDFETSELSKVL